jgi:hypothetical protein
LSERKPRRPVGLLVAAMVCLCIGGAAAAGLILRGDDVGRSLFAAAWGALGIVWLGRYATAGRRRPSDGTGAP